MEHAVLFLVALVPRAFYWLEAGTLVVRDGTRYIAWCQEFSLGAVFGSRQLAYVGYWMPYCGWLRATDYWIDGWVGVQVVLSALACVLVYETARILVDNRAGIVAGGLLAVQWEVYKRVIRPQSEFMLTAVVAVALWRLAVYYKHPTVRNRVFTLAGLGFVALVRPNGLIIVAGFLLYDLFPRGSSHRLDLFLAARWNVLFAGVLGTLAAYRLAIGWARGSFLWPWRDGIVITPNRFVYEYSPTMTGDAVSFFLQNIEHVLAIAVLRGLWFFSPVMPGWNTTHAIRSGVTLTPLFVGGLLGIGLAAVRDRRLLKLWGTPVAMVVLTAMVIWVAGWRNFLGPAAVALALFAGYFASVLEPRLRQMPTTVSG